jgi:hypothetical protein
VPPAQSTGNLEQHALPDLLTSVCATQETGVLRLTRHGISKSIYIQEGRIVFATSTDPDDRLGELLLTKGLLHIRDFEEASSRVSQQKRLGALLVEMGSLKAEELVRAVIEQVKDIVFDLFLWSDGEFSYSHGELPSREVITLKLSTPEVILGGVLRISRWSRVLRGLGGLEAYFRACSGKERLLQQMQLRVAHAAILQALEAPVSVRDLCRKGLLADFEVCRVLWAFRVIGLVEPVAAADLARFAAQAHAPLAPVPRPPAPPAPRPKVAARTPAPPTEPPAEGLEIVAQEEPAEKSPLELVAEGEESPFELVDEGEESLVDATLADVAMAARGRSAAAAGSASEAESLDESQLDSTLASFNERHSRLYTLLQATGGEKVREIIKRSVAAIDQHVPGLFNGLAPGADGTFDVDTLKTNIFAFGVVGYSDGLSKLMTQELEMAGRLLGNEVRQQLAAELDTTPV